MRRALVREDARSVTQAIPRADHASEPPALAAQQDPRAPHRRRRGSGRSAAALAVRQAEGKSNRRRHESRRDLSFVKPGASARRGGGGLLLPDPGMASVRGEAVAGRRWTRPCRGTGRAARGSLTAADIRPWQAPGPWLALPFRDAYASTAGEHFARGRSISPGPTTANGLGKGEFPSRLAEDRPRSRGQFRWRSARPKRRARATYAILTQLAARTSLTAQRDAIRGGGRRRLARLNRPHTTRTHPL